MTDADTRQHFLFPDSDIRGEIVRLEQSFARVAQARDYPMSVQGLLGEALAAATLMVGTLKFDGRLSLQAQGPGPVSLLLAEATHEGGVRGLAKHGPVPAESPASLRQMLGRDGLMAITIRPAQGRQYQGVVPLDASSLAGCLEHYFVQSEQLPTRVWLASGNGRAAGLLLQRLPDRLADAPHNAEMWRQVATLADTLTAEELLDLPPREVLRRLFHEVPPELPPARPVGFACTCSRQRIHNTLVSLGADELQSMLDEQGEITVSCDFCGSEERFDAVDLRQLIHEAGRE